MYFKAFFKKRGPKGDLFETKRGPHLIVGPFTSIIAREHFATIIARFVTLFEEKGT